jgi:hypothetical protein
MCSQDNNEKLGSNKNKQKVNIPFSDAYKCDLRG